MEYLYLSEDNLRNALGPALFRNKDLRRMAEELGESPEPFSSHDELVNSILQALCFNLVTEPVGIVAHIEQLENIHLEFCSGQLEQRFVAANMIEVGKILERVLKDLLQMYAWTLWGDDFLTQLKSHRVVPRRDGRSIASLMIGQALAGVAKLGVLVREETELGERLCRRLGRTDSALLPDQIGDKPCDDVLRTVTQLRNRAAHDGTGSAQDVGFDPNEVTRAMENLLGFLRECRRTSLYPDVMRYEGTFENRDGERFVYFVDEMGQERRVRTDERINPRQRYYCVATTNPLHLFPTLIPKL